MQQTFTRKNIIMVACVGKNGELGKDNQLIFNLKEDKHFFRDLTLNNAVLMGRKTFDSLPKLLDKRHHIILTHKSAEEFPKDVTVVNNLEQLLKIIEYYDDHFELVFVIGGAEIYELLLPYTQTIYLTKVDAEADADCYFPKFDEKKYHIERILKGLEKGYKYEIIKYKRK